MDVVTGTQNQQTTEPSFRETALIELCLLATVLGPILCFALLSR